MNSHPFSCIVDVNLGLYVLQMPKKRKTNAYEPLQSYGIHYRDENDVEVITYVDFVDPLGQAHRAGLRSGKKKLHWPNKLTYWPIKLTRGCIIFQWSSWIDDKRKATSFYRSTDKMWNVPTTALWCPSYSRVPIASAWSSSSRIAYAKLNFTWSTFVCSRFSSKRLVNTKKFVPEKKRSSPVRTTHSLFRTRPSYTPFQISINPFIPVIHFLLY